MLRLCLLVALCATLAAPPLAARELQVTGPVATLSLAIRLYARAEGAGDALGMAVAVRLAGSIHQREASHWQKESGKFKGPALKDAPPMTSVTPDLLTSGAAWSGALLMAEEDEALSDLLYELPPVVIRGGLSRVTASLAPGAQDSWTLPFAGQSPAEVAVFAAGEAAAPAVLTWSLEDSTGGTLCPPRRVGADICSFTPQENGFYRVVIANPSASAGSYLLAAN